MIKHFLALAIFMFGGALSSYSAINFNSLEGVTSSLNDNILISQGTISEVEFNIPVALSAPSNVENEQSDVLSGFDIMTYVTLSDLNSPDYQPADVPQTSCIIKTNYLNGDIYQLEGFLGRSFLSPLLMVSDEGLSMPLGQTFTTSNYKYQIGAASLEDNVVVYEGQLHFSLLQGDVITLANYDMIVVTVYSLEDEKLGYNEVAVNPVIRKSNASISYVCESNNTTISHRLFATYTKDGAYENENTIIGDLLTLTAITPDGYGNTIGFYLVDTEGMYYGSALAYTNHLKGANQGKYYLCSYVIDEVNKTTKWMRGVNGRMNADYMSFVFPNKVTTETATVMGQWSLMKLDGTRYGNIYNCAEIKFDYPINTYSEAATPVIEVSDGETCTQKPEYYNLQGMKVTNPLPGQIIIIRNGSKVIKSISR